MSKKIVICDLDGTLADGSHREYLIKDHPRDWDTYFDLCHLDVPNWPMVEVLERLAVAYKIVILTGRIERTREKTENWLLEFQIPYHELIMRPTEDRTDDHILKVRQAINNGYNTDRVLVVFEDRNRVVKSWRDTGYFCLQVREGDF